MKKLLNFPILVTIYIGWLLVCNSVKGYIDFEDFFLSLFITILSLLVIIGIKGIIWRIENGVDVFATLETDPENVKEHMLFIMQFGHSEGMVGALKEFNDIFRNYPQWELHKWEVFRAWYKHEIDAMTSQPGIYVMTMKKDGSEYSKDKDPLYDPDAPDWEQFDRPHNYDDDDEFDDNDDDFDDDDNDDYNDDDNRDSRQDEVDNAFCLGLGMGMANGMLNK